MKEISIGFLFVFFCVKISAQKVSNIRAEQRGQEIVVLYSLETNSPCEVSLLLSQDNGATWSAPLKNVSGDVGKNISAGEKQITWKVLEEKEFLVGDKMKFKVIANGRKSFEPEMVFVEGGTFQMGNNYRELDEKPVHSVILSSFYLGKYEITQSQWRSVMGPNDSYYEGCDNCPVEKVSWNDAQEYIQRLNAQSKKNYRLPTEAEWEYAAQGGNKSNGYVYSGANDVNEVAWCTSNSGGKKHNVGTKQPNELGIFDMSGNVWEWCSDWFDSYSKDNITNPTGGSTGEYHILRGGSWSIDASSCRSTNRYWGSSDCRVIHSGFRLVLPLE